MWHLWITRAHELTPPRTYMQACVQYLFPKQNLILTKLGPHEPEKFWLPMNIDLCI